MTEYGTPEKITIEVKVSRVIHANGKVEYVLGTTPGLRLDTDRCILVSEDIVKGVSM